MLSALKDKRKAGLLVAAAKTGRHQVTTVLAT